MIKITRQLNKIIPLKRLTRDRETGSVTALRYILHTEIEIRMKHQRIMRS